jgi:hypothetical protein
MAREWILEVPSGFFDNIATQPSVPGEGNCPYPGTTKCKNHTGTFVLTDVYPGVPVGLAPSFCPRYSAFYLAEGPQIGWPLIGPISQWNAGCVPCGEQGTWMWYLAPQYVVPEIDPDTGDPLGPPYYNMVLELGWYDSSSGGGWKPRASWSSSTSISCIDSNELVILGNLFENSTSIALCCDDLPETVTVRPL